MMRRLWRRLLYVPLALTILVLPVLYCRRGHGLTSGSESRSRGQPRTVSVPDWFDKAAIRLPATSFCVLHVGLGPEFEPVNEMVLPNKRRYAARHGYHLWERKTQRGWHAFHACSQMSLQEGAERSFNSYRHTQIKFCAVLEALDSGCSEILWTDGDAFFVNETVAAHELLNDHPEADLVLSTCGHGCELLGFSQWQGCLNTGAILMRDSMWLRTWLRDMLTHQVPLGYASKGFNQCGDSWAGDQCVLCSVTDARPSHLNRYACIGRLAGGPNLQQVLVASDLADFVLQPDPLLLNCAGGDTERCVRTAMLAASGHKRG